MRLSSRHRAFGASTLVAASAALVSALSRAAAEPDRALDEPASAGSASASASVSSPAAIPPVSSSRALPSATVPDPATPPPWVARDANEAPTPASSDSSVPSPHEGATPATRARLEAGGSLTQGLDATDRALRQGGAYVGGAYAVAPELWLLGRYALWSGYVTQRLPGSPLGRFGEANDAETLQTRHRLALALGYRVTVTRAGGYEIWALPSLGPRVLVLKSDLQSLSAFQIDLAARAGFTRGALSASAFLGFAPAVVKSDAAVDVHGRIRSELYFGADLAVGVAGPWALTLGYEGDVVHQRYARQSFHSLLVGLALSFE